MMVLYNLEKFSYVIEEILFCLLGAWFMFVRRRRLRCLDCCKSAFASFFTWLCVVLLSVRLVDLNLGASAAVS